jgi:hypothetical protein
MEVDSAIVTIWVELQMAKSQRIVEGLTQGGPNVFEE